MSKKKKYKHHKMGMPRKVMKTIGTVGADALIIMPLAVPMLTAGSNYISHNGTWTLVDSVNGAMGQTLGVDIKQGSYDMGKIIKYGIFSALAIGGGLAAKKYVVKRL
jgi:hypothetical protein